MEHLAQPRGDRGPAADAPDPRRQFHRLQPLHDELPRLEDVDGVIECGDHLRQPELRDGAHVLQAGQAADGQFHRQVICASVSCGFKAAAVVLICTCTGVVSGKASIGRMLKLRPPMTTSAAARTQTSRRFLSEKLMIQFSMAGGFLKWGSPSHPRSPRPDATSASPT